jgi:membrane associated rhomboid family serine protease
VNAYRGNQRRGQPKERSMYNPDADASPINPLPNSVVLLLVLVGGIELVLQLAERGMIGGPTGIGWRLEWARAFGYFDPVFEWMRVNNDYGLRDLSRFATYPFIHVGGVHILFVLVFIAALGKFVAELLGDFAVLVIFMLSAIAGAFAYGLIFDDSTLLIGGYPAVYGLLGAFTWVKFLIERMEGKSGLRAFGLIGFFMTIQLAYKLFFGGNNEWLAELFGFGAGFTLAIIFGPGGISMIRHGFNRLRQR